MCYHVIRLTLNPIEAYGTELEQGKAIKYVLSLLPCYQVVAFLYTHPDINCYRESGIKREKLYITTKLSPSSHDDIQGAFRRSLKLLQLDYVDL